MKKDAMTLLPVDGVELGGYLDHAIRFIEDYQLLDAEQWAKFVNVFTERPRLDGKNGGWRGEYWGKMMRGACMVYHYTQSPALYRVLTKTVEDMLAAPEADGRFSSYERDEEFKSWDMWCRKYVLLGLEYFYDICTDEGLKARILPVLRGCADYILAHIGADKLSITKTSNWWYGVNSSSILEPMVRLYNLTGEQKYLDFATYIVENGGSDAENLFELAYEDKTMPSENKSIKAYEIMSCFEGLIEYYRVTGIEKWREAALRYGKKIYEHELSILGTCGTYHELFDHARKNQLSTHYTGQMQETCVTVTWIKFCLQLLRLSGDVIFADAIEKAVYNALLGSVNFDKNADKGGLPFDSYSPVRIGTRALYVAGGQILSDGSTYSCCAAIAAAGMGAIPAAASMLREDGIAVNLYIPGTVAAKTPDGGRVEIDVKTDYPLDGLVTLTVNTTSEQPFTIALRVPSWSYCTALSVNAEPQRATAGSYAELNRVWKCGDTVTLSLDMRTEIIYPEKDLLVDENSEFHVALRRGPLTLARDARLGNIQSPVSIKDESGFAEVTVEKAPEGVDARALFLVTQNDGSKLPVIDYASAGRTWNEKSLVEAWMHTKNFFPFDDTKEFEIIASCRMASGTHPTVAETKFHIGEGEDGLFYASRPGRLVVKITDRDGDKLRLAVGEKYLAVNKDGKLTTSKKGSVFTLCHLGHHRYCLVDSEGRFMEYDRANEQKPVFFERRSQFTRCILDFVNV